MGSHRQAADSASQAVLLSQSSGLQATASVPHPSWVIIPEDIVPHERRTSIDRLIGAMRRSGQTSAEIGNACLLRTPKSRRRRPSFARHFVVSVHTQQSLSCGGRAGAAPSVCCAYGTTLQLRGVYGE